jgi:hypothetical protein
MTAKLKRMDQPKYSRNGKVCFQRLYFELEDGSWAATDLVPSYRNYKWWEPVIKSGIGTEIGGVFLKDNYPNKINADSQVYIVQEPLLKQPQPEPELQSRVYSFPSFTNPKKSYEVTYCNGIPQCSCFDFKYRTRKCKHIKALEQQKVDEARKKQTTLF